MNSSGNFQNIQRPEIHGSLHVGDYVRSLAAAAKADARRLGYTTSHDTKAAKTRQGKIDVVDLRHSHNGEAGQYEVARLVGQGIHAPTVDISQNRTVCIPELHNVLGSRGPMASQAHISSLNLANNRLSRRTLRDLLCALEYNKTLTCLDLSGSAALQEGPAWRRLFTANPGTIQKLVFNSCWLPSSGPVGLQEARDMLASFALLRSLSHLELNGALIDDASLPWLLGGPSTVEAALTKEVVQARMDLGSYPLQRLKVLSLADNCIGAEGLTVLTKWLSPLHSCIRTVRVSLALDEPVMPVPTLLEELILDDNHVSGVRVDPVTGVRQGEYDKRGLMRLGRCIGKHPRLRVVGLRNNNLGFSGATKMYDGCDHGGMAEVCDGVRSSVTVQQLFIGGNHYNKHVRNMLRRVSGNRAFDEFTELEAGDEPAVAPEVALAAGLLAGEGPQE